MEVTFVDCLLIVLKRGKERVGFRIEEGRRKLEMGKVKAGNKKIGEVK